MTCAAASSSSAARRMTLPEVDMLPEIEKQITSRPYLNIRLQQHFGIL